MKNGHTNLDKALSEFSEAREAHSICRKTLSEARVELLALQERERFLATAYNKSARRLRLAGDRLKEAIPGFVAGSTGKVDLAEPKPEETSEAS